MVASACVCKEASQTDGHRSSRWWTARQQRRPASSPAIFLWPWVASIPQTLKDRRLKDVTGLLRGPIGTKVGVQLLTKGKRKRRVTLERQRIRVPVVVADLSGGIGYLAVRRFQEGVCGGGTSPRGRS